MKQLCKLIILALAPVLAAAEDAPPDLYLQVECMKSTHPDYTGIERDIWQPVHQELVERGKRNSWALYWVMYGEREECDYYTVTSFLGSEQLNADPDFADVFATVHPGRDLGEIWESTYSARDEIRSELWRMIDATDIEEHLFAIVNTMHAEDADAYELMESRVFKPAHEALIDSGERAGWAVYELISPTGTSVPYNYSTVDFVNHLNPVPMAETMMATHPDRDLEQMHNLLQLREHVRSETWQRVAGTTNPED